MADLHEQSYGKSSMSTWILTAVVLLAILYFLAKACTNVIPGEDSTQAHHGPATREQQSEHNEDAGWNNINFNAPAAKYEEITDKNISVRGNENFGIYSLGENILFDEGKSSIRPDAEQNLKQVAASIEKRYGGADVRVYGFTDALGSAGSNKQLAEQRATAVKDWLTKNGNIAEDKVSLQSVGEERPVASNASEEGRQQNRRVEIVAKKG